MAEAEQGSSPIHITAYRVKKDNVGWQAVVRPSKLGGMWAGHWPAGVCRGCPDKACPTKEARPMWSPTTFRGKVDKSGVVEVSALVLDYDECEPPWECLTGYEFIALSSHSGGWHIVLPFNTPCPPEAWGPHLFEAWPGVDERCKDIAHRYFAPFPHPNNGYHPGPRILWSMPLRPASPPLPPAPPAPAPPAPAPPKPRERPSKAMVDSWVSAFVGPRGDGQRNRLAGALGGCLSRWGWSDEGIQEALEEALPHDEKREKAISDALRAAENARGDVTSAPGIPALKALGVHVETAAEAGQEARAALERAELDALLAEPLDEGAGLEGAGTSMSARDMVTRPKPVTRWVCETLGLARGGAPWVIAGYGGTGKTTLLQDLAIACATPGRRFLGEFVVEHGPVGHIDFDAGSETPWQVYLALGLTADATLRLEGELDWHFKADAETERRLVRYCRGKVLVIVDSLRACMGVVDENSSTEVRPLLDLLKRVSVECDCAIALVHHEGKSKAVEGRHKARGSSAIVDASSALLTYQREKETDSSQGVRLRVGKLRRMRPPALIAPRGLLVTLHGDEEVGAQLAVMAEPEPNEPPAVVDEVELPRELWGVSGDKLSDAQLRALWADFLDEGHSGVKAGNRFRAWLDAKGYRYGSKTRVNDWIRANVSRSNGKLLKQQS